jgi:hypothetical protein
MECIFYCINDVEKQKKSKPIYRIVEKTFYSMNELTNVVKMRNYKNHFYTYDNSLELSIYEFENDTMDLDIGKKDNTMLLKFDNDGLIYLKNYLKNASLSSFTKYISTLIQFYKHMLQSISLLVTNQIVHNHINIDSIYVDKYDNPLLTNFVFSIDISKPDIDQYIKHFIIAYDPSYLEWPLEFHILAYLLTNKLSGLSSYNIENIICNVIDNHTILKTFGPGLVSSYKEEALNYFKKYVNQSYEYILNDILQFYGTWDNYALSIMFLEILISIHKSLKMNNKFIIHFMKLLVGNIHLNPLKRDSVSCCTNKFQNILDSLEPKDYYQLTSSR